MLIYIYAVKLFFIISVDIRSFKIILLNLVKALKNLAISHETEGQAEVNLIEKPGFFELRLRKKA